MKPTQFLKIALVCSTMLGGLAPAAFAAEHEIPMIDMGSSLLFGSDTNYVTGGVGEDERSEIEGARANYNVHILHARQDGAFVEDTQTTIRRKNGKEWVEVLSVEAGPLLYIVLPEGSYEVEATRHGVTKKQKMVIGKNTKSRDLSFAWKPLVKAAQ